jgi:hypothetical protein
LSTPDRLVPDTHAYTHDGQRQVPHHRPDIRAQLTGSFTDVDQRFIKERRLVSLPRGRPSLPADRLRSARRGACLSIALVTRHGIPSSNAGTTTRGDRAPPRRAIRSLFWRACWTVSGVAGQPALKPRHSATAWISAVTSKSSRRSNCQGLRTGLPALIVDAQAFRQSKERLPLPGPST